MFRIVEGTSSPVTASIVDEYGVPLVPDSGSTGPLVSLYDSDKSVIYQAVGSPTTVPGEWQINLPIPYMNLVDEIYLDLRWELFDEEGIHRVHTSSIVALPATENRQSDIVTLARGANTSITFVLPVRFDPAVDTLRLTMSLANEPILEDVDLNVPANATLTITNTQVVVKMQIAVDSAVIRLEPVSVSVEYVDGKRLVPKLLNYNLWIITPQIGVAMNMLEQFIDRAKLDNVIPALQYTAGDMVNYLYRGLQKFNSYPPHLSAFTGTNMQGTLLECWLICASHSILSAQLLAEGAHAFDFAGQDVNLNVDRTPSIEAALGRLETELENTVKPYKKQLAATGNTTGDGSIGSKAPTRGAAFGATRVLLAPTTKVFRGPGPWIRSVGIRGQVR